MGAETNRNLLDRLFDPVARCLNLESAERIVRLRADGEVQARLDVLAEKSTEGDLTQDERAEYETFVRAIQFLTVLQSKSRQLLNDQKR